MLVVSIAVHKTPHLQSGREHEKENEPAGQGQEWPCDPYLTRQEQTEQFACWQIQ